MEFLECVKFYAKKPANNLVNTALNKPDIVDWNERLQTIRRSMVDQLSRLKIEEVYLRNLTLKAEQNKRVHSTINSQQDNSLNKNSKRLCTAPSNNFDIDAINQTDLDLDS